MSENVLPKGVDHIVLATPHLEATVTRFADLTGVRPVEGGSHPGKGTKNHLVGLGEGAYLELIGLDPDQPDVADVAFGVDRLEREAIVTFAVGTDDINATVAAAIGAGHDPGPVTAGSRSTPDGRAIDWRITLPTPGQVSVVPFVIDWGDTVHPSMGLPHVVVERFALSHPDPDTATAAMLALGFVVAVQWASTPRIELSVSGPGGTAAYG
jgi:hypothetical protein